MSQRPATRSGWRTNGAGWLLLALAMLATAAAGAQASDPDCATAPKLGYFDPVTDLFVAQFDIKTDVDDLHSAAAVASILGAPEFACVRYLAVAGTYGIQDGDFIAAPRLFERAFGDRWRDAHGDRAGAVRDVSGQVRNTLEAGGDVWIMEAGQSDFSAAVLAAVLDAVPAATTRARLHVVQHSDWNESVSSPAALAYVRRNADYRKIPDGNATGNGSPGYRTPVAGHWERLLADERFAAVWREARRIADEFNGQGYDNEAVGAGGLDFSDTVEAAYIFGLMDLADTGRFIDRFMTP